MKKRSIHIILATVLFGVLVWLSVTMRDQYQATVAVPLTIESVPEGLAIKTPVPQTLQLKFRGDGWRLAALLLGPDLKLALPLNTLPSGSRAITFNEIAERFTMRPGIQLVDVKPESIFVGLDRYAQKKVLVVPNYAVSFREGYGQVGTTSAAPESVTISGAESVLNSIDSWRTARTVFENLKAPVEADLPLNPSSTYVVSFNPQTVHIRMNVQPFAERIFNGLPVEILSVPFNREVILIPPKIEVVVRGGIKQLSNLTSQDFRVSVDYMTILSDTTGAVDAEITSSAGVQVVSKRPEHLQYIVRRRL